MYLFPGTISICLPKQSHNPSLVHEPLSQVVKGIPTTAKQFEEVVILDLLQLKDIFTHY